MLNVRIHSYVVRYDSGFAPNPFYGLCTLATCKPDIRSSAQVGDWIVGTGSNEASIRRGCRLVYAMRVTEIVNFRDYDSDLRFEKKKPYRFGSRKQSCGDNIYFRSSDDSEWLQRDSFHTCANGERHSDHVATDTGVDRVLVSEAFVYFGGEGPKLPDSLRDTSGKSLCRTGIGRVCFEDPELVKKLELWLESLVVTGYQGPPYEWISLRGK